MKVNGDIYNDTLKLHVIDLILKDVGTSGYTEYDWGTTLAEYFEENEDKWPVMFFSIHSHHTMGVTPSGVDDKHLYDNIENFPFHLSIIVNNKLDFNARIATDMMINTVSVRSMDSSYISKEVTDAKLIIEYSLPVTISDADTSEFEEEFNKIQASKVKEPVKTYSKNNLQQEIPFTKLNPQAVLNKYSLGTLFYEFTTLQEVLTNILTEADVDIYLDKVEAICMDYVDQGKSKDVKSVLYSLMNTYESSFPNHPFIKSIAYGLSAIYSLVESVNSFDDVEFGNKKVPYKDISRMTDEEWRNYVLNS